MVYGLCEINATTVFSVTAATSCAQPDCLKAGLSAYPPKVTAATVEYPPVFQSRTRSNRHWRGRKKLRRIYFSKTMNMAYGQFEKA